VRLQELRQARELEVQREELGHLKGVVERQERSLGALEEELVTERTVRHAHARARTHTHTCTLTTKNLDADLS